MLTIINRTLTVVSLGGIKYTLLSMMPSLALGLMLSLSINNVFADTLLDIDGSKDRLILPNIDQQDINNYGLDKEDFELVVYTGSYAVERFDNQPFFGLQGSFFFTNRIFLDINYGTSNLKGITESNDSVDTRLNRYGLSIAYNLLDGKVFLDSGRVLSNQLYVKYGRGNIDTLGPTNNYSTLGIGIRVLGLNDMFSFHTGANHDTIDSTSGVLSGTNLKLYAGIGIYF